MAERPSIRLKFLDLKTCDKIITAKNEYEDEWDFISREGDEFAYMYILWQIADAINAGKYAIAKAWMKLIWDFKMGWIVAYSEQREVFYHAKVEMRNILAQHNRSILDTFPIDESEEAQWGSRR